MVRLWSRLGEERSPFWRRAVDHFLRAALVPRRPETRLKSASKIAAIAVAYSALWHTAAADLLPAAPLPPEGSAWVNFEILPAEPGKPLAAELREIEGGKLQAEQAIVSAQSYRKTSIILPLAGGDRREVILLLAEEAGRLRMLGFHRIHRHLEAAQGTTVVFQSGLPNSLTGEPAEVPADTYTYMALCTALAGIGGEHPAMAAHLWFGASVTPVDIALAGREKIDVLGTQAATLRISVKPRGVAVPEATYWFSETPPRLLLQYRGPGDFLVEGGKPTPTVMLRATASSEQVRRIFR